MTEDQRIVGGLLYKMGMFGWFGLITIPSGFLFLIFRDRGLAGNVRAHGEQSKDADQFQCLGCGAMIQHTDESCRKCGWSWK